MLTFNSFSANFKAERANFKAERGAGIQMFYRNVHIICAFLVYKIENFN